MLKIRALLLLAGVVASQCAATPVRRMIRIPAGSYRALYMKGPAVPVAAFSIDRDPVTRGEYLRWRNGSPGPAADGRRPMTDVTWREAGDYCAAQGGRLPTLGEWEYAAAATKGVDLVAVYSARSATPPAVDRGAANALGVRGMHDLVWEWVADPNDRIAALYHAAMGHGHHHATGGAHDMSCAGAAIGAVDPRDYPAFLRAAFRSGLTEATRLSSLGFRCAVS